MNLFPYKSSNKCLWAKAEILLQLKIGKSHQNGNLFVCGLSCNINFVKYFSLQALMPPIPNLDKNNIFAILTLDGE